MTKHYVTDSDYDIFCIDNDYAIKGDFNSYQAANLMVVFEVCDRTKRTCKSDVQIQNDLEGSYILLIDNQETYNHHKNPNSGHMIDKLTHISWHALSTVIEIDFVRKISM